MALDLDIIENLIRTEADADVLALKLRAMIEKAHPAAPFADGEEMVMHEFVARFKRDICEGNETRFWQWPVHIVCGPHGELGVAISRSKEKYE